jgi:hypothetical protein
VLDLHLPQQHVAVLGELDVCSTLTGRESEMERAQRRENADMWFGAGREIRVSIGVGSSSALLCLAPSSPTVLPATVDEPLQPCARGPAFTA